MDPPYETFHDVKFLAAEQRLELQVRVDVLLCLAFSAPDAACLIDANTVMTKPNDVRFWWLMAFWTDWFVCDGVHDRQNVSLHQSIRASGVTADFHYEEEVNLTFHLQCVMRVIRKCGPNIKETLRSCPLRCGIARKPKAEAITRNEWGATHVQHQIRTR